MTLLLPSSKMIIVIPNSLKPGVCAVGGEVLRIILVIKQIKSGIDHGRARLLAGVQIAQSVSTFESVPDTDVLWVRRVESWGHDPFAETEDSPGFEHSRNLGVDGH